MVITVKVENHIQDKIWHDTKNQISDHIRDQLNSISILVWKGIGSGRVLHMIVTL